MIEKLKQKLIEMIKTHPFELYDVHQTMIFGQQGLEILVDSDDGPINTEALEHFHHEILQLDDTWIPDHYVIEVSSVGIERPLETNKDYDQALGKYIYVVSDYYKGYADLIERQEDMITIEYLEKTKKIKKVIPIKTISAARRAVKF
jgi:ribosome maturation factor RimP